MIKGVGIDTIELERIARVYGEFGDRFLEKICAQSEIDYFGRLRDPVPAIAGRFAAKEACMKALGTGWNRGVRWRDVEVARLEIGKPEIVLHGKAEEIRRELGGPAIHCTITHSKAHATALVILEKI